MYIQSSIPLCDICLEPMHSRLGTTEHSDDELCDGCCCHRGVQYMPPNKEVCVGCCTRHPEFKQPDYHKKYIGEGDSFTRWVKKERKKAGV